MTYEAILMALELISNTNVTINAARPKSRVFKWPQLLSCLACHNQALEYKRNYYYNIYFTYYTQ